MEAQALSVGRNNVSFHLQLSKARELTESPVLQKKHNTLHLLLSL